MLTAILVSFLLMFGMIFFIGNYELGNGLGVNATIATNFNAIGVNPSAPAGGIFSGYGNLANGVQNTGNSLQTFNTNPISSAISSVSLVGSFLFSLPNLFLAMGAFIAVPLTAIGIPLGFAQAISSVALIGIFALGLLSAVFLFPL